jgi:hypothetical protein
MDTTIITSMTIMGMGIMDTTDTMVTMIIMGDIMVTTGKTTTTTTITTTVMNIPGDLLKTVDVAKNHLSFFTLFF